MFFVSARIQTGIDIYISWQSILVPRKSTPNIGFAYAVLQKSIMWAGILGDNIIGPFLLKAI